MFFFLSKKNVIRLSLTKSEYLNVQDSSQSEVRLI